MAETFVIEEHTFEGQHIREHPRALASSQEDIVKLHAKSYTPHDVANGSATADLTIIAFHANAFHKEVYEPFFEELYRCLRQVHGVTIGSIWIADQAAQGASGLLNDGIHGNDPSWFDHSRDVLQMTNVFRRRMKRPIVAVGHSMGGTQAVATAHLHPRLFEAVVIIDAPISLSYAPSIGPMVKYALHRAETHDTREQAEQAIRKSPLFKGWDPRVVQRYIETAFHSGPTAAIPNNTIKPITTKHVEASTLARANTEHVIHGLGTCEIQRALHPSLDPEAPLIGPVYNHQPRVAWSWLPSLRPSALFLHGEGSRVCRPDEVEERTRITGTAAGGSGGMAVGRVKTVTVAGGHFAPMTNVEGTAETVGQWLSDEIRFYRRREGMVVDAWREQEIAKKQRHEPAVEKTLKGWNGKPWAKEKADRRISRL